MQGKNPTRGGGESLKAWVSLQGGRKNMGGRGGGGSHMALSQPPLPLWCNQPAAFRARGPHQQIYSPTN